MDGQDSAKCQNNPRLEDIYGINKIVNEEEDKRVNSDHLLPSKRDQNGQKQKTTYSRLNFVIFLGREHLLSRIPANRIVGSRRSKKQSCSTRRGLRVDASFVEFRQLQEVGIFSYLC